MRKAGGEVKKEISSSGAQLGGGEKKNLRRKQKGRDKKIEGKRGVQRREMRQTSGERERERERHHSLVISEHTKGRKTIKNTQLKTPCHPSTHVTSSDFTLTNMSPSEIAVCMCAPPPTPCHKNRVPVLKKRPPRNDFEYRACWTWHFAIPLPHSE